MDAHATLTWTPAHSQPRKCTFTSVCDIGRAPSNRIILASPKVSRHHVRLHLSEAGLVLHNHSRSKGVLIGSDRVAPGQAAHLKQGDRLHIGDQVLSVVSLQIVVGTLICSKTSCGKSVPADQRDCPWCGTSMAFAQTQPGTRL